MPLATITTYDVALGDVHNHTGAIATLGMKPVWRKRGNGAALGPA